MKVKEYLPSLMRIAKLKRLKPEQLNKPSVDDLPLIVSCTSIPSRFKVLDKTVRSVLNQSRPPSKMVLWLHDRHKGSLPRSLTRMVGPKFEIRFTDLDSPHCKLVPSLLAFPSSIIVTCDDDLMYEPDWLETLWESHRAYPTDIIAHIARNIAYDDQGRPLPYRHWTTERQLGASHKCLIPMGYGGVLYPIDSLSSDVTHSELYLKLAPKADDLWFKAMSLMRGTASRKTMSKSGSPFPLPNSQKISLKKSNVREDGNSDQWKKILEKYPSIQSTSN